MKPLFVLAALSALVSATPNAARAAKLEPVTRMSAPAADAVLKAAASLGRANPARAYKLKYYYPSQPGGLDDIYFYDDQVKRSLADAFPAYGEADGYNITILGPSRWEFARRELAGTPFLLAHEPLLDAMIAGVQTGGLTVFWVGRTVEPRGIYAYGIIDYQSQELLWVVNIDR